LRSRDCQSFCGVAAIQDVSLRFAPGSLTAIIGPNGAGKTTFFNLISGAIRPDKGRVTLSGEDIVGLPPAQIARRGVARSFQIASAMAGQWGRRRQPVRLRASEPEPMAS
jgi:branched-chain amino acid transport system ATP-binding protein